MTITLTKSEYKNLRYALMTATQEAELERLDKEISRKRKQLQQMTAQACSLSETINRLFLPVKTLEEAIQRATNQWKA